MRCSVAAYVLLLLVGCTSDSKPATVLHEKGGGNRWVPGKVSSVQVQIASLGGVANSGLLLPTVSPDGKSVAYLEPRPGVRLSFDALLSGKGLEMTGLCIRPTKADSTEKRIAKTGAAWPAWSGDGSLLFYVSYSNKGRCDLVRYDVQAQSQKRLSVGLSRMTMLSSSADGLRVAAVSPDDNNEASRLFVIDVKDGKVTSCPRGQSHEGQYWPQWTADGRIVYVLAEKGRHWLAQWVPGISDPQKIAEISVSSSSLGVHQMLSSLGEALSPNDERFAFYDTRNDRIVLVNLWDGKQTVLPEGTRSGTWLSSKRFVFATNNELKVYMEDGQTVLVQRGPWLPLWSRCNPDKLILCTRGERMSSLRLVEMLLAMRTTR